MSHSSQFSLLSQRRFAPFFWTQFLGAFNDNVFKTALLIIARPMTRCELDRARSPAC